MQLSKKKLIKDKQFLSNFNLKVQNHQNLRLRLRLFNDLIVVAEFKQKFLSALCLWHQISQARSRLQTEWGLLRIGACLFLSWKLEWPFAVAVLQCCFGRVLRLVAKNSFEGQANLEGRRYLKSLLVFFVLQYLFFFSVHQQTFCEAPVHFFRNKCKERANIHSSTWLQ